MSQVAKFYAEHATARPKNCGGLQNKDEIEERRQHVISNIDIYVQNQPQQAERCSRMQVLGIRLHGEEDAYFILGAKSGSHQLLAVLFGICTLIQLSIWPSSH